jgi:hypothetical protein
MGGKKERVEGGKFESSDVAPDMWQGEKEGGIDIVHEV